MTSIPDWTSPNRLTLARGITGLTGAAKDLEDCTYDDLVMACEVAHHEVDDRLAALLEMVLDDLRPTMEDHPGMTAGAAIDLVLIELRTGLPT